jgi:hypothetical protein
MAQTLDARMQAKRITHANVCPTLELKNVATKRLNELREKKTIQGLLLQTLHSASADTSSMQCDTDIRMKPDIRMNPDIRIDADISTMSFNEHVSEIISLQDTIFLDYVRVCNIRLRSHATPPPSTYIQEAATYMSILTALIAT